MAKAPIVWIHLWIDKDKTHCVTRRFQESSQDHFNITPASSSRICALVTHLFTQLPDQSEPDILTLQPNGFIFSPSRVFSIVP